MFRYFEVDRDEEGRPKPPADLGRVPSYRDQFAYRCFLGGVYDRAVVARLWREEQVKQRGASE